MAKTILNRNATDLFFAQRSQVNESGNNGDFWRPLYADSNVGATLFNGWVDTYNSNEDEADNGNLQGTDPGGNNSDIAAKPTRPRPIHK